jgi:head-tail adaptor
VSTGPGGLRGGIGVLDKRCRIEYKVVAQDPDYGTEIITWALLAVVWCNAEDVIPSRSEAVKMQLATAVNQTRWRGRYRSDVDSSMRLTIWRPMPITYQIIGGPAELGNKEGIELMLARYSS